MNTKTAAFMPFLVLLITAVFFGGVFAQISTATVGVSRGNSFKYNIIYSWKSSNPSDFVPASLIEKNQTAYLQLNVTIAGGAILELQTMLSYLNGTSSVPQTQIEYVGNVTDSFIYVYPANLTVGSSVFPLEPDLPWTVNQTVLRGYEGNNYRETNYYSFVRTDLPGESYASVDIYFDKQTGVLVEATLVDIYSATPNQTFTTHIVMKESSIWAVSSNASPSTSSLPISSPGSTQTANPSQTPSGNSTENFPIGLLITIAVVAVIIIVAAFLLLRKGKPKPKQEPDTRAPSEESSYSI